MPTESSGYRRIMHSQKWIRHYIYIPAHISTVPFMYMLVSYRNKNVCDEFVVERERKREGGREGERGRERSSEKDREREEENVERYLMVHVYYDIMPI